jgi:hypothetical protein
VFHPWTYEGAIDITQIRDPLKREAILVQINEFGQTPKMIFTTPHPKRFSKVRNILFKANFIVSYSSLFLFVVVTHEHDFRLNVSECLGHIHLYHNHLQPRD